MGQGGEGVGRQARLKGLTEDIHCAAFNHLPLLALASKAVFGEDLLQAGGIDHRGYVKLIGERPTAQKVVADRKAAQARL